MTAASTFIDPNLVAQAVAAQGAGADGRTVLTGQALASVLKQLSGVTQSTPGGLVSQYQDTNSGGTTSNFYNPGSYTDAAGDALYGLLGPQTQGAFTSQADYDAAVAAQAKQMGLDPSQTYLTSQFDNPTGNGSKDQATGYYTLDANGNAVPVGGSNAYSPGNWVDVGRNEAMGLGTVLTAGALGGAFGAGATGTSAGSTGALSSSDLGSLYGNAGYGSLGGDLATAGSEALPAAGAADMTAVGGAPAYGGVGTEGAGAGSDAIVNGSSGLAGTASTGLPTGTSAAGSTLSSLLNGTKTGTGNSALGGGVGAALAGAGAALVNGSNSTNINVPNYQAAATAQGQSARTNQTNPYGSLTYTQTGTDAQGNPTYSQNVALNAQGQSNLNSAQQAQGTALTGLNNSLSGYDAAVAALPGLYGDTGSQTGLTNQAINAAYGQQTALLDPQYTQQQAALTSQLANQGISLGSQAYNTAMNNFAQQRDYAYGNARDSAINQGNALANQLFNQNLSAHTTGMNDLTTEQSNYSNAASGAGTTANALNPTFAAAPASTNYLGAAALQGQGNLQQYNATTGANNSTTNGLFNLGGAVLSNPAWTNLIGSGASAIGGAIGNLFSTGGG